MNDVDAAARRLRRRRRFDRAFAATGLVALLIAAGTLATLVAGVTVLGAGAFVRYEARLDVRLDAQTLGVAPNADAAALRFADYRAAVREAFAARLGAASGDADLRALQALVSPGASFDLARRVSRDPALVGETVTVEAPLSDVADQYFKGRIRADTPAARRPLSDAQIAWLDALDAEGAVRRRFNAAFLAASDSSYPELAGVAAGVIGSLMAVGVALVLAGPMGVITAVFLEEFAPKNRITDLIEISINNLAAIPSIVFGLLGLAAFVVFFGMPRSAPLVGGLVLALSALPTVIISTRAALRALPTSLKEGALALGATRLDAAIDPVLPAAAPGVTTGVILGLANALGETAPLLLIGMVAFVAAPPESVLEPASALPVLVYLWAESPERAFVEKTAGAVLVLLALLAALIGAAAWVRARYGARRS